MLEDWNDGENEERVKTTFFNPNTHCSTIPSFQKSWQEGRATRHFEDHLL
jgi:hypothetical protein